MYKYFDIIVSQNTTQFYAQYVQCISQLHVSAQLKANYVYFDITFIFKISR